MDTPLVLVVGGAGYIGSYVNKLLNISGFRTLVYDNLSKGLRENVVVGDLIVADLADQKSLDKVFTDNKIDAVMHFAAFTDVGQSVLRPDHYYQNNVVNTLHLLNAMVKHRVNYLIFSSSAAIFGTPPKPKVSEDDPQVPINPYGETKLMDEKIIRDYSKAFPLKSVSLRYFNAAGADPDGDIAIPYHKLSNLIPVIINHVKHHEKTIVFGEDYPTKDGTCVRDYIHIHDLTTAHIQALLYLMEGGESNYFNLGNGEGFSVKEVIEATEKAIGQKVLHEVGPRRAGDPAILVAESEKAKQILGWQPIYPDLEKIIGDAWRASHAAHV